MENPIKQTTMSSREIAEWTNKQHDNVLKAIRKMEPAWEKVTGVKFNAVTYDDVKGEKRPMYQLSKLECLYISTKFNDEERAKLVLRWQELEMRQDAIVNAQLQQAKLSAERRNEISVRIRDIDASITRMMSERKSLIKERNIIDSQDYALLSFPIFPEWNHLKIGFPNKSLKPEQELKNEKGL